MAHKQKSSGVPAKEDQGQDSFRRTAKSKAARAAALLQKQTRKDLAAAIALLQESARLLQAGHWNSQAADAYLQIGEAYFTLSKYDKALSAYRQALQFAGSDRDQRSRALSGMARTYATRGRISEADSYSQRALSLSTGLANPKTRAEALEARGEVLYWSGNPAQAAEALIRARDLFAEAKDDDGQARALLMLAWVRFDGGESLEVLRLAEQALQLWSAHENDYGVARARFVLGTSSARSGQFETAGCYCEQAQKVFEKVGDRESEAVVLNDLGFISMEMGYASKSLDYYQRARTAFGILQDRLGEATAIEGMGRALAAMQQYGQLLPLYETWLHLAQQAGNSDSVASAQVALAGVYELKRWYLKAETLYDRSLANFHRSHNPSGEGYTLMLLAELSTKEGKYSRAISFLERARPLKQQAGQVEELAKIDYELAFIYRRLGRLKDALEAIQRTIDIIESQRLKMSAFDSRASYFASVHKYYALYIQLLMLLDRQDPQLHSAVKAFEASEKSKVRSLLDWLAGSSPDAPCDELLKRQLEIADSGASQTTDANAQPPNEVARALTLDQVRTEIADDDAILLEYALGDEKSYVWVVNRDQISAHELPAAKRLDELVHAFRNSLTARQSRAGETNAQYLERLRIAERDYRRSAAELSRLLLGPVLPGSAKRLIIVPDGSLQYVPFAALPVPKEERGKAVLADNHEVVLLPSGSALGALRKAAASKPPPTAAAAVFADPVFEFGEGALRSRSPARGKPTQPSSVARSVWRRMHPASQRIPRLPASHKEADAVRDYLGPDGVYVASDFAASRETFLRLDLGSYRVIHFATHGLLDEKHPEQSGLILSLVNEKGQPQDGYLPLSDIYNLKLSADLVVLSSCDSGLGQDLSSEGIIGLPRAFLRAGAKSVIATLWKVDDEATAKLMTHFYSRMHQGESPASALRYAQIELSQDERWSHPYYWAAFVLQGDYRLSGLN